MKYLKGIITIFLTLTVSVAYCATKNVTVTIDYGGLQQNHQQEIAWKDGITALEALQSVVQIETKPLEKNIIVTSINGIQGIIGDKVWYYDINGKHAAAFANKAILSEGDHIIWHYTKDVCSSGKNKN